MVGSRATWGPRALGYLIDFVLPGVAIGIIGGILGAASDTLGTLFNLLADLALLAWAVYNYGYKQGTTGYTLGKGIVGIKLVDATTGQPVGFGLAVARYFVHILDALPCFIGFLWPLWDANRETFADKVLKQAVVTAPKVDPRSFVPDQLK